MADKKISGLSLATSVSSTDVLPIVQTASTNKVTLATLFGNVPGDIKYSGLLTSSLTPESVTTGAISVLVPTSYVINQTGVDSTLTLAAGSSNMEKTIVATDLTTKKVVVTLNGQGFASLTFNATGSTARLIYTNNKWFILSLNNVTTA